MQVKSPYVYCIAMVGLLSSPFGLQTKTTLAQRYTFALQTTNKTIVTNNN